MNMPTNEQVKQYAAKLSLSSKLPSIDEKALHVYRTSDGTAIYWRVRVKCLSTGEKWIRPFYWDGGKFITGEPPAPPEGKPLFALELLALHPAAMVIVVEGENKADAINKAAMQGGKENQIVATTSGGASSAQATNWQSLLGRVVVVWPDNDEAGAKYAADVVACLQSIAASVMAIDVAAFNLPHKGDAVDYFKAGGTMDSLMLAIESAQLVRNEVRTETVSKTEVSKETVSKAEVSKLVSKETVTQQVTQESDLIGANNASDADVSPEITAPSDTPPAQSDDEIIQWLATLKILEYERVRIDRAKTMNCRPAVLDGLVKLARSEESEADRLPFAEVEPHSEPIDPAQLLDEVSDTIQLFIVLNNEQAHAAALWVAFTWFIDVVKVAPLAVITAPEMACGKSQLRDLLSKIVMRPLSTNNMKAATLFRIAEKWHPSLMLDEVDLMLKSDDEIINLVNAGHHRGASQVWRLVGDNHEPKSFDVWGAKCFAGIALEKIFPPSTLSRAIIIKLRRKLSHESVARLRHADEGVFSDIAAKLARFAADYSQQVRAARPVLPDALSDRDQDNWEGLLAIASCAGDAWLARATAAALKLSGAAEKTQSTGNELLADIQHVFESKKLEKISTVDLIAALCEDEEGAWATYNRGKPLNPRQVKKRLEAYGISSKSIRLGSYEVVKGFELKQFADAFERYLSTPINLRLQSYKPLETNSSNEFNVTSIKLQNEIGNNEVTPETPPLLTCNRVTAKTPIFGDTSTPHKNASHLRI